MTDSNDISSQPALMRATAQNIENLQRAVINLQAFARAAKEDAQTAKEAATTAREEAKRWKLLTRVLGVFVVLSLAASGLSIYNWTSATAATNQLRQQSIAACGRGNARANGIVVALDELVTLLEGPNPTPAVVEEGKVYEGFVLKNNAPRNCAAAYSPQAAK